MITTIEIMFHLYNIEIHFLSISRNVGKEKRAIE